jgi:hypothetical protein
LRGIANSQKSERGEIAKKLDRGKMAMPAMIKTRDGDIFFCSS